jgi:RNA polymerase sigma factor (sigma-70 family)
MTDQRSLAGRFESARPRLLAIARRLLSSTPDAEDAVQEAWLRLSRTDVSAIDNLDAWLTTVVSRVSLDILRAPRRTRERSWNVEAWPAESPSTADDPAVTVERTDQVTAALVIVLDALSPAERVAFVLHEVFRYPYAEVASIVGRTPAACRQLTASARRRLRDSRTTATSTTAQADLVRRFKEAWQAKDVSALIGLLDPKFTTIGDGGGVATAIAPAEGLEQVARAAVELLLRAPDLTIVERTVNGRPGLVTEHQGVVLAVLAFDVADDRISRIWTIRNPDKLRAWSATPALARTADLIDLRPIEESDLDDLRALHSGPDVLRHYDCLDGLPGCWAAVERQSGEFVGYFELRPVVSDSAAVLELDCGLVRAARGKGYATTGSQRLIDHAFSHWGTEVVTATTMAVNTASRRVMERCGLTYVRTVHRGFDGPAEGLEQGEVEYRLTREDWLPGR